MKPGSFSQLYVQIVFAVHWRRNLIHKKIQPLVFEYIGGIARNLNHKTLIVNGMPDHIHILIGLNPNVSISDTVHDIKRSSSLFINENHLVDGRFCWQEGYGCFSYNRRDLDIIFNYIKNQEQHHLEKSFRKEYLDLLVRNEVDFNPMFTFDFLD